MKKVIMLLTIFAFTSFAAFADGNPQESADATFTGTVIAPLQWGTISGGTMTLPKAIAGQTRTTGFTDDVSLMSFLLEGEAGQNVIFTNNFALTTGTPGDVTLDYDWGYDAVTHYQIPAGGELTQTFKVNSITSIPTAHGPYVWTISVDAIYTDL
jgi:hypothetical protein